MHNKLLYITYLLILCSCQVKEDLLCQFEQRNVIFTIKEAKTFFESDVMSENAKSTLSKKNLSNKFSPGDFTPIWNNFQYSISKNCAAYDVDINSSRKIIAIRSGLYKNRTKTERLMVYQKLVIMKNTNTGMMGSYILSLIPEVGCDDARTPTRFLSRRIEKGEYSGIAVYTSTANGSLHCVQQFKDGDKIIEVNLDSDSNSKIEKCRKAMSVLRGIVLLSKKNVVTKFGENSGDDVYDDGWDYGSIDDYISIGGGLYMDSDGYLYIDYDNDGKIDSFYFGGSTCTPDDSDDGDGGDGGGTANLPEYPEEKEDDDIADIGGGGDSDSGSDVSIIPPRPLTEYIGTTEFYRRRAEDFKTRYGVSSAPLYYLDYGEKYCLKFQNITRNVLSEQGKEWVDKTLVALQVKLNKLIIDNPALELDETSLKAAAFKSHVDAYIESGVLELPLKDKIEILLTVDWKDLSDDYGKQQVFEIIQAQLNHYGTNTDDRNSDAWYLMNNKEEIMFRITLYILMQTQTNATRSSSPNLNEEYIFNLILGPLVEYYEENIPEFYLPNV